MSKEDILQIPGASGSIPTFAVEPEGPVAFILTEAAGIRKELRDFARRISRAGYHCLPPDMCHRPGTLRLDLSRRGDRMIAVIGAATTRLL